MTSPSALAAFDSHSPPSRISEALSGQKLAVDTTRILKCTALELGTGEPILPLTAVRQNQIPISSVIII